MDFKSLIIGTATAAALAVVTPAMLPEPWNPVPAAQAGVDVSVSFNTFYDRLGSYGEWTDFSGAYVFVPGNMRPGWRPYTVGHWVLTRQYGWMWISDEPFGWATYHYGRWGYDNDIGWYWVPGWRWAPAWVSWRRSKEDVVWAPLPPSYDDNLQFNASFGVIPDYYWVGVPTRRFLEPNLSLVINFDVHEQRRVYEQTRSVGNVIIRNNIVVNNAIDVNVIERQTGRRIKPLAVRQTNQLGDAKVMSSEVTAFTGNAVNTGDAKPAKIMDLTEVKKIRADRKDKINLDNLNQPGATGQPQLDQNGQPVGQPKNTKKNLQLQQDQNGQPQLDQNGQPVGQPKNTKQNLQLQQDQNGQPLDQNGQPVGQPKNTKKKLQLQQDQNGQPLDQNGQPVGQPKNAKKKLQLQQDQNFSRLWGTVV
ncbi:MAG: hypothetical protein HY245_03615 [Rhizobiales bacterium]|nr:hypothetical protein [Hyphomicrobiales bacterium]